VTELERDFTFSLSKFPSQYFDFLAVQQPMILTLQIMCSYQGHVSAALVLGGVDITGPHLHTVSSLFKLFFDI